MIIRVTFCVEVTVRPYNIYRTEIQLRTINGEWDSIDEAFMAACNAGAIPDKQMKYEYN